MMNSEFLTRTTAHFAVPTESTRPGFDRAEVVSDARVVDSFPAAPVAEETLVVDDRSSLTPAQMVESKLTRVLKEASLPVSHLQMRGLLRSR